MRGSNFSGDFRKKRFSERPVLVVIRRRAAVGREANALQLAAVVDELRGEDRAVSRQLAFARVALDQHAEVIARLQIGIEIDLAREHIGHAERELDALAGLVDRGRSANWSRD